MAYSVAAIISVPELDSISSLQWLSAEQVGSELTTTTILRGKADKQELFSNLIFDSLRESEIGIYGSYAGHTIKYGYGKYDEITLTAVELTVSTTKSGYYNKFEATNRTDSVAFEEKIIAIETTPPDDTTYLTWWNHMLVSTVKDDPITIDDWQAITDGGVPSGYIGECRWVKTNQAKNKGDYVIMNAAFPNQNYGAPLENIKELIYTRDKDKIVSMTKQVGYLKAPEYSDGESYDSSRDTAAQWLITSASYRKNLGWYEGQRTYTYAKNGWLFNANAIGSNLVKVYPDSKEIVT